MNNIPSIAFEDGAHSRFEGAKVTVFVGSQIVTLLRDDISSIPWPDHWDLPGGGREGFESGWACAARECLEEVGLMLDASDVVWARQYSGSHEMPNWFFVAHVSADRAQELRLGDEGQRFALMDVDAYLTHPKAIPNFQKRLADWCAGL